MGALEKQGLIRLLRTAPSEKGGKDKKIWGLAFEGLVYVLQLLVVSGVVKDKRYMDKLIKAQSENLLIFNKWSLFKNAGVESLMLEAIEKALQGFVMHNYLSSKISKMEYTLKNFPTNHDNLTRMILSYPFASGKASKDFLTVLKNDSELSDITNSLMANLKLSIERNKRIIELWANSNEGGE